MSFSNDDELNSFVYRDHMLPMVTTQAVATALEGFNVNRINNRSADWLAMAVRRALAATLRNISEMPHRAENTVVRKELKDLARRTKATWLALWTRSPDADTRIWDYALRSWDYEDVINFREGIAVGDPTDHRRFNAILEELDWLGTFLDKTADETQVQPPRWREREWRELRIERDQYLFPIFETTFAPAQLNTFTDFYQRMVWLAFSEDDIPDLEALISEMKRRHDQAPVVFNSDFIPGF